MKTTLIILLLFFGLNCFSQTAVEQFEKYKQTDETYLKLEQAANDELKALQVTAYEDYIKSLIDKGYSGKATARDWLLFMKRNGDKGTFGTEENQNIIAKQYDGNLDEFLKWFKKYKQQ